MLSQLTTIATAAAGLLSTFSGTSVNAAPVSSDVSRFPSAKQFMEKKDAQKAPHFFIYSDKATGMDTPPPHDKIPGWNSFGLSFWLLAGPWDQVQNYVNLSDDQRKAVKDDYSAAGIKLILALFGATDVPTTSNADPAKTAKDVVDFVKKYGFDGVDVDYEDFGAMQAGTAEQWLIDFTKALRTDLPQGDYQITHAPVAPWFTTNTTTLPGGGYLKVHEEVGDLIDFYNLQFYNQGQSVYTDCESLINKSNLAGYEESSLKEIIASGVDGDKIVIGKPGATGDANSGYMPPGDLATCVSQAKSDGWNGGLMIWQYPNAPTDYVSQVWGS